MKLMLTKRNQITIPKEIVKEFNMKPGDYYEIEIVNGQIILTLDKCDVNKVKSDSAPSNYNGNNMISNIDDINKYTNPKLSPCKLVVRSKTSYIKQFCDRCKGELVKNDAEKQCSCNYYTSTNQKQETSEVSQKTKSKSKIIIKELIQNVNKLDKSIDNKINAIEKKSTNKSQIVKKDLESKDKGKTVLEHIILDDYKKCKNCGEFFKSGMLLNGVFHCTNCAKEDFKEYFNSRRKK